MADVRAFVLIERLSKCRLPSDRMVILSEICAIDRSTNANQVLGEELSDEKKPFSNTASKAILADEIFSMQVLYKLLLIAESFDIKFLKAHLERLPFRLSEEECNMPTFISALLLIATKRHFFLQTVLLLKRYNPLASSSENTPNHVKISSDSHEDRESMKLEKVMISRLAAPLEHLWMCVYACILAIEEYPSDLFGVLVDLICEEAFGLQEAMPACFLSPLVHLEVDSASQRDMLWTGSFVQTSSATMDKERALRNLLPGMYILTRSDYIQIRAYCAIFVSKLNSFAAKQTEKWASEVSVLLKHTDDDEIFTCHKMVLMAEYQYPPLCNYLLLRATIYHKHMMEKQTRRNNVKKASTKVQSGMSSNNGGYSDTFPHIYIEQLSLVDEIISELVRIDLSNCLLNSYYPFPHEHREFLQKLDAGPITCSGISLARSQYLVRRALQAPFIVQRFVSYNPCTNTAHIRLVTIRVDDLISLVLSKSYVQIGISCLEADRPLMLNHFLQLNTDNGGQSWDDTVRQYKQFLTEQYQPWNLDLNIFTISGIASPYKIALLSSGYADSFLQNDGKPIMPFPHESLSQASDRWRASQRCRKIYAESEGSEPYVYLLSNNQSSEGDQRNVHFSILDMVVIEQLATKKSSTSLEGCTEVLTNLYNEAGLRYYKNRCDLSNLLLFDARIKTGKESLPLASWNVATQKLPSRLRNVARETMQAADQCFRLQVPLHVSFAAKSKDAGMELFKTYQTENFRRIEESFTTASDAVYFILYLAQHPQNAIDAMAALVDADLLNKQSAGHYLGLNSHFLNALTSFVDRGKLANNLKQLRDRYISDRSPWETGTSLPFLLTEVLINSFSRSHQDLIATLKQCIDARKPYLGHICVSDKIATAAFVREAMQKMEPSRTSGALGGPRKKEIGKTSNKQGKARRPPGAGNFQKASGTSDRPLEDDHQPHQPADLIGHDEAESKSVSQISNSKSPFSSSPDNTDLTPDAVQNASIDSEVDQFQAVVPPQTMETKADVVSEITATVAAKSENAGMEIFDSKDTATEAQSCTVSSHTPPSPALLHEETIDCALDWPEYIWASHRLSRMAESGEASQTSEYESCSLFGSNGLLDLILNHAAPRSTVRLSRLSE